MAKIAIAMVLGVILSGAMQVVGAKDSPWSYVPRQGNRAGNLVLYALGTGSPGPGQVRIPVPVEGTLYEVIIAKPGAPRLFLLAASDATRSRR